MERRTEDILREQVKELRHQLAMTKQTVREQGDMIKDLKRMVNTLQKNADADSKLMRRLLGKLAKKERLLAENEQKLKDQNSQLNVLENELARVTSILNLNSRNSSKPPSTDQRGTPASVKKNAKDHNEPDDSGAEDAGAKDADTAESPLEQPKRKQANEYNGRKSSGRKKGGQPNRTGKTLTTEDVQAMLAEGKCRHVVVNEGTPKGKYKLRYTIDFEMIPVIIEHRVYEDGRLPERLKRSQVVYGDNVRAAACFLYTLGGMSNELITTFLRVASGDALRVSHGAVYGFLKRMSKDAEATLIMIENELLHEPAVCTDATYVVENGGFAYIRSISSPGAVLYTALQKKDKESIEAIPFFRRYRGIMIHDHEIVMYSFKDAGHAECNAHGERYLRRNTEETGNSWSTELETLLNQMNDCKKANDGVVPERIRKAMTAQYHMILAKGFEQNRTTKYKFAKDAEKCLLKRLTKYSREHLRFMEHADVPFTNNMAERDLRKAKKRSRSCGGFREHTGNEMYCALLSIAETAKRKEVPLYETLKNLAAGEKQPLFPAA